jgi:hypothetical protein
VVKNLYDTYYVKANAKTTKKLDFICMQELMTSLMASLDLNSVRTYNCKNLIMIVSTLHTWLSPSQVPTSMFGLTGKLARH